MRKATCIQAMPEPINNAEAFQKIHAAQNGLSGVPSRLPGGWYGHGGSHYQGGGFGGGGFGGGGTSRRG